MSRRGRDGRTKKERELSRQVWDAFAGRKTPKQIADDRLWEKISIILFVLWLVIWIAWESWK